MLSSQCLWLALCTYYFCFSGKVYEGIQGSVANSQASAPSLMARDWNCTNSAEEVRWYNTFLPGPINLLTLPWCNVAWALSGFSSRTAFFLFPSCCRWCQGVKGTSARMHARIHTPFLPSLHNPYRKGTFNMIKAELYHQSILRAWFPCTWDQFTCPQEKTCWYFEIPVWEIKTKQQISHP